MNNGDLFKATDRLDRTYLYQYIGPMAEGYDIELKNLTLNEQTIVDPKWFETRKIERVIIPVL